MDQPTINKKTAREFIDTSKGNFLASASNFKKEQRWKYSINNEQ
jgi:hypothetical protein